MSCKDCGQPTENRICEDCRQKRNIYMRQKRNIYMINRRKQFKEAGLCYICGNRPPAKDKGRCNNCIEALKNNFKEKPNCIRCGRSRKDDPKKFIPGKNKCRDCVNKSSRIKRAEKPRGHFAKKRHKAISRNFESFLRYRLRMIKSGPRRKRCKINYEFLIDMLHKQGYKCAITNIPMTHKLDDLTALSIDRINSSGEYTPDNVQLVCKAVNLAKNSHSQSEAIRFFEAVKQNGRTHKLSQSKLRDVSD